MEFGLLGPLVVTSGGRTLHVGGVRTQLVLAGLLLHAGRTVSVDELVDLAWDDPPTTARKQIQTVAYRLRAVLNSDESGLLHTDGVGYRLDVDSSSVDVGRFMAALQAARARVRADDLPGAAEAFRTGLGLWRGRPLAGLPGTKVALQATRLSELHLAAIEDSAEIELRLGHGRTLIPQFQALVAEHPLRERITALLMIALAGDGRQADAIKVYQGLVATLHDELGVEPGHRVRDAYLLTLRSAEESPTSISSPAAVRQPENATTPRCLPWPPRQLVGRDVVVEHALAAVHGGYGRHPNVIVVDGMAGVGKSALALAIAHAVGDQYADAHLFIDLQGHSEHDPVTVYDALGVLLQQLDVAALAPESAPGRISSWRQELSRRRALVVLDNAAGASQVEPLLPYGSASLVIVTSRTRLAPMGGETSLSLPPLDPDDAVRLMRDSADERVDRDPVAAAAVVEQCGRLPLAIRLVGHRLRHRPRWTVGMLASQLAESNPAAITVSAEGHSTAAAFELSYRQLTEPEQRLFRRLGLHPVGTFEVWPAAALADVPVDEVLRLLDRLVEVHLVEADLPGRHRMHDLLHAFALTLVAAEERQPAIGRMLDYYLQSAQAIDPNRELRGVDERLAQAAGDQLRPFATPTEQAAWLAVHWPTLVALIELAHRSDGHRYVGLILRACGRFVFQHGHSATGVRLGKLALASATTIRDDTLAAATHLQIAGFHMWLGQRDQGRHHLVQGMHLYEALSNFAGLSTATVNLAVLCRIEGRLDESLAHARAAQTLAARGRKPLIHANLEIGTAASYLGLYDVALRHLRLAGVALGPLHGPYYASVLGELGRVHLALGHPRVASALLRRAIELKTLGGDLCGAAEATSEYGRVVAAYGDPAEALRYQRDAYRRVQGLLAGFYEPAIGTDLGETLTVLGRYDEAIAVHAEALRYAQQSGRRYEQARAHAGLAVAHRLSDPAAADAAEATALALFRSTGMGLTEARAMLARHPAVHRSDGLVSANQRSAWA